MHSLIIEPRACPRCGIRRTTRLWRSSTSLCFNCRWQWDWTAEAASRPAAQPSAAFPFSSAELARLEVYRAAVRRGFYTDW